MGIDEMGWGYEWEQTDGDVLGMRIMWRVRGRDADKLTQMGWMGQNCPLAAL